MKIDGLVTAALNTYNNGSDIMSKLKPGDNIRAQILGNSGNELTLKFSDGSIVTAAAASAVEASEGEFVNLTYKGTVDEKPAFEVADKTVQPQADKSLENIRNTLASLKLPATERNMQLAQALSEQNVPVTAESMAKMSELLNRNPELKPNAAAFLTASKLPDDPGNIDKLQSLLAGRLKIGNDIAELVKLINPQGRGLESSVNSSEMNKLAQKLVAQLAAKGMLSYDADMDGLKTTTGFVTSDTGAAKSGNPAVPLINGSAVEASEPAGVTAETAGKISSNGILAETKNIANTTSTTGATNTTGTTSTTNTSTNSADSANTLNNGSLNQTNSTADLTDSPVDLARNSGSSGKSHTVENTGVKVDSPATDAERVINLIKGDSLPVKEDLPVLHSLNKQLDTMIFTGQLSQKEQSAAQAIAREISTAILKIQSHKAGLEETTSTDPVNKSIDRKFETAVERLRSLYIRVDENSDEINPVKLYKEMDSVIQTLKSSIQQLPQGVREAAAAIANNLESNLNFINQLNNYSSYVQLPLSMFSQNTTGELYMLKKGSKARKLDPSNMTVLISLDTNNVGRIDTLLSVDKKNISTNFRLENSEVFPVLKENHKQLYNSLLEKGFRLVDFTYRLMDEPLNIVNFEAEAKKEFIKSPNNIDITI